MNRGSTLTAAERQRLDAMYADLGERCIPLITAFTGFDLPAGDRQTFAFDRVDWVNANLEAFRKMFAPLEDLAGNPGGANSVAAAMWGGLNRRVISAELGFLLGYLARRVLGQYDLALLGREPVSTGKLYYVEPNIQAVEQSLGLPRDEFRMWLALHETTHAFEFEAHPWVRVHFNDMLEAYFAFLTQDVERLKQGFSGIKLIAERARVRSADTSWVEALMTPDQRVLFQRMQAMMCIVEGYSNYVMNGVGRDLLPSYDRIVRRFEERRGQRGAAEQLFARLIGLDMKLEQYRLGEAFIDAVAAQRGHEAVKLLWADPNSLPTMVEIRAPRRWMDRVLDGKGEAPGGRSATTSNPPHLRLMPNPSPA